MSRASDNPRPTVRRQVKAVAVLVVTVGIVLGIAYAVYYFTVGRPLLGGDHDHDFGTVQLVGNRITLDHTFVLTNRTGHPVEIQDIKTSCGCTVASPSERTLAPGASVEIDTTLTMRRDGRKTARVYLNFGDDGMDVLHLEAVARRRQRLSASTHPITLTSDRPTVRTILYFDYDSNDEPPLPKITAPAGVQAQFTSWMQVKRRRSADVLPARWQGRINLQQVADTLPDDAELVVQVGPNETLTFPFETASSPGPQSRPESPPIGR